MADDWTDDENDAIVADYFAVLAEDVARRPYNKARHNRMLQTAIDRTHGSIEYKHRNISVVLKGLGEDWIPGYKPAFKGLPPTTLCSPYMGTAGSPVGYRTSYGSYHCMEKAAVNVQRPARLYQRIQ